MTPEPLTEASDAELDALSELCLRSKAYWGYDADFIGACRDVLSVKREDLVKPNAVIRVVGDFAGYARVDPDEQSLSKLFVCPKHMGKGVGSALITWAKDVARDFDLKWLEIESDPDAAPFYMAHGAVQIGEAPSEVFENRFLPLLRLPTAKQSDPDKLYCTDPTSTS